MTLHILNVLFIKPNKNFGIMADLSTGQDAQRHKYNGKELDRMHGLDWYDYGARHYDAIIGRWATMDPLCEKYYSVSPYAYCGNNPIKFIDSDGKEKLIFFQPHIKQNDVLIQAANKFKDDGAIHIFTHGSSQGIVPYVGLKNNGHSGIKKQIQKVDDFLELLNMSETWRNRKGDEHLTIVLHACKTGMGEDSFAEKLSQNLTNVTIIAPDNTLYMSEEGEIGVYYPKKDIPEKANDLKDKDKGKERSHKKGSWKVFENGKVTSSFDGDWIPKTDTNWLDDLLYKQP